MLLLVVVISLGISEVEEALCKEQTTHLFSIIGTDIITSSLEKVSHCETLHLYSKIF